MSGLLVALDLADRDVLAVGGGAVAERKVAALLAAGARVTLIAPEATSALAELAAAGRLTWHRRPWRAGDGRGRALVFAATDSREVNRAVAAEARAEGVFVNVAAPPDEGDLQLLATHRVGPLAVGISTGGASPFAARKVREQLEAVLPVALGELIELLGELRGPVQETYAEESRRRAAYERIWSSEALALLEAGDPVGARAAASACLRE